MAHIIERVCAKDLALTTVAHQSFEESVERLYLSLLKTNAVILDLGEDGWDDKIQRCLAEFLPDGQPEGPAKRGVRGRPAIARLVKEFRLGQRGRQDWCEQEDLQHVCPSPTMTLEAKRSAVMSLLSSLQPGLCVPMHVLSAPQVATHCPAQHQCPATQYNPLWNAAAVWGIIVRTLGVWNANLHLRACMAAGSTEDGGVREAGPQDYLQVCACAPALIPADQPDRRPSPTHLGYSFLQPAGKQESAH